MIFRNKKGDIPITILVLGTFAICALALLSFYVSGIKIQKSFVGVDLMEKMDSKINEYYFYEEKGFSEEKIKQILEEEDFYFGEDSEGRFFEINKTKTVIRPKFNFNWKEEKFLFSVKFDRNS